jgi:glycosyltransferase involved in cell wall biosynthesis
LLSVCSVASASNAPTSFLAHGTNEPPAFLGKIDFLQHLAPWHLEEVRRAGVWKPTWTAIPNFIDVETFRPGRADSLRAELGVPAHALVVLTVAAVKREHKRIDYLLAEFARLRAEAPDVPLWLVVAGGRESDTDQLVAQGRELLGDRVRFLVGFPRARMPDLYRAADLFVLCSLREMMPMALLEATASGLPCVVNDHPILRWMIGPGGAALPLAAPGALAAAVQRLVCEVGTLHALGRQAQEHCVRHFSRDRVLDQVLDYYRLVSGFRRPRAARAPTAAAAGGA